jgi:hypothetical protein
MLILITYIAQFMISLSKKIMTLKQKFPHSPMDLEGYTE